MRLSRLTALAFALLSAAVATAALSFNGPTQFPTGLNPSGIASGDFDNDGDFDFAVTVDTPDRISVYLNNGAGTFGAPVNYPTGAGTGPDAITAADLDGDTDLDLAVTLKGINQVRTYLNQGNGAFLVGPSAAVGLEPVSIVAGQFGGTPAMDLATSNREANTVSILISNGAGYTVSSVATQVEPRQLVTGDFDGDNDLDLFVTNHDSRTISFLRNSAGVFSNAQSYPVHPATRPDGIAAVDIDGDLDLDLGVALSDDFVNYLAVFKNNGNGTMAAPVNYATGGINTSNVAFGDFDGDGDADAALSNNDSNNMSFMENNGVGVFGAATLLPAGTRPGWVEILDLNNDGGLDVAVANRDSGNISFYHNNNAGAAVQVASFAFLSGTLVSGNLASLHVSDDNRLVGQSGIVLNSSVAPVRIELVGQAPVGTASAMRFTVESSSTSTNIAQMIEMFNFSTGQWVVMDTRATTVTDSTLVINVTTGAAGFVDPVTGNVRSRIHYRATGPVFAYPWNARLDLVRWTITP
jgi:hypothetical protein